MGIRQATKKGAALGTAVWRQRQHLQQGRCRLISPNGYEMGRFVGLGEQIAAALDVGDAILDGEVIAPDETGRPQCARDALREATLQEFGACYDGTTLHFPHSANVAVASRPI